MQSWKVLVLRLAPVLALGLGMVLGGAMLSDRFAMLSLALTTAGMVVTWSCGLVGFWGGITLCFARTSDWTKAGISAAGVALTFIPVLFVQNASRVDKDVFLLIMMIPLATFTSIGVTAFCRALATLESDTVANQDGWRVHRYSMGTQWLCGGACLLFGLLVVGMAYDKPSLLSATLSGAMFTLCLWGVVTFRRPQLAINGSEIWIRSWWRGWQHFNLAELSRIRALPENEFLGWELTFGSSGKARISKGLQRAEKVVEKLSANLHHRN